jgi:hypothetical protein
MAAADFKAERVQLPEPAIADQARRTSLRHRDLPDPARQREQIAWRARSHPEVRGGSNGPAEEDWLRAEQECGCYIGSTSASRA